jgi:hypothetical protein
MFGNISYFVSSKCKYIKPHDKKHAFLKEK